MKHPRDLLPPFEKLHPFGDVTQIDVTAPPYNADPTGKTDSTEAIVRAIDALVGITRQAQIETVAEIEAMPHDGYLPSGFENRKVDGKVIAIFPSYLPYLPALYFPEGTYRISDRISYTYTDLKNSFGSELNRQLRLIGANRENTIIQLVDNAEGYQNGEPKPVVDLMRGKKSNVSMANYLQDLTIDTGRGNPTAIGLNYFTNNSGAVRRVTIRSGDGTGYAGLRLSHGSLTGVLVQEIAIEGFDTGIELAANGAAEHIELRGQRQCGIRAKGGFFGLRKIDSRSNAPALICESASSFIALVDSTFSGSGAAAIQCQELGLYADAVVVQGYQDAVVGPQGPLSASTVREKSGQFNIHNLALPHAFSIGTGAEMERLTVLDPPRYEGLRDGESACGVRAFGAVGDGRHNDDAAIQRALDSGAAEICFEAGHYRLDGPVTIPATVRRIHFQFVDLITGPNLAGMEGQGAFVIQGESEDPLFLEGLFAWELWRGKHHTFDHACRRTVVIRDMHLQTSPLYANSVPGGKVFLDNFCSTPGVLPGATGHGRACVRFHGQQVWCRQFDPERGEPMALNDGGTLWVLGYKTEDSGIAFQTINGGRSEVLGGMLFSGRPHTTAFVNVEGYLRCCGGTTGGVRDGYYGTAVTEIRNGMIRSLKADALPLRGSPPEHGPQYHIPLYVSRASLA